MQRKSIKKPDGSLVLITEVESMIYEHIMQILKKNVAIDDALFNLHKGLSSLM